MTLTFLTVISIIQYLLKEEVQSNIKSVKLKGSDKNDKTCTLCANTPRPFCCRIQLGLDGEWKKYVADPLNWTIIWTNTRHNENMSGVSLILSVFSGKVKDYLKAAGGRIA